VAANFYRSAAGKGVAVAGVPLDTVEDAVTAAVRMGYRVAQSQIDRTTRIAQRLKDAGDRAAGPQSDKKALDATEQLVFKALMTGLGWFEGLASDRQNPLKRLATAEFQLLGALFGLHPEPANDCGEPRRPKRGAAAEPAPDTARDHAAGSAASRTSSGRPAYPSVRQAGAERRVVKMCGWEIAADVTHGVFKPVFYCADAGGLRITSSLTIRPNEPPVLSLTIPPEAVSGTWKAPICDKRGIQLGFAEFSI
jgi:hypothetical protein